MHTSHFNNLTSPTHTHTHTYRCYGGLSLISGRRMRDIRTHEDYRSGEYGRSAHTHKPIITHTVHTKSSFK